MSIIYEICLIVFLGIIPQKKSGQNARLYKNLGVAERTG